MAREWMDHGWTPARRVLLAVSSAAVSLGTGLALGLAGLPAAAAGGVPGWMEAALLFLLGLGVGVLVPAEGLLSPARAGDRRSGVQRSSSCLMVAAGYGCTAYVASATVAGPAAWASCLVPAAGLLLAAGLHFTAADPEQGTGPC